MYIYLSKKKISILDFAFDICCFSCNLQDDFAFVLFVFDIQCYPAICDSNYILFIYIYIYFLKSDSQYYSYFKHAHLFLVKAWTRAALASMIAPECRLAMLMATSLAAWQMAYLAQRPMIRQSCDC